MENTERKQYSNWWKNPQSGIHEPWNVCSVGNKPFVGHLVISFIGFIGYISFISFIGFIEWQRHFLKCTSQLKIPSEIYHFLDHGIFDHGNIQIVQCIFTSAFQYNCTTLDI
jgi:hypothetical protein